jgi:glyoxylase-like metal-dependent hydrolase (beta-lactamase superfamily II)
VRALLLISLCACATIPAPKGPAYRDAPKGAEVDVCVLWGERNDRPMIAAVAELSFVTWHQAIATVVIRRPLGETLVDPAFGTAIAKDLEQLPPWFTPISGDAKGKTPTIKSFEDARGDVRDVRDILLTHAHWDHAGAVRDLPYARIQLSRDELTFLLPLTRYLEHGVMPHQLEGALGRMRAFAFDGPPLLRFEASHDVYGDGSVIAVPLPGHTPGSTGYLVRGRGGKRWLLIGDAAWAIRGVEKPGNKTVRLLDSDWNKTNETLGRLHALREEHPEIVIVPAHDASALETMPTCAKLN